MERRILITGGSKGIGAAIGDAAARRGWTNLVVGRDEAAMRALIDRWRARSPVREHKYLAQDLIEPSAVERIAKWLDEVGSPDTVVQNAATGFFGRFAETGLQKHADTIALGVRLTVELTHALLPPLCRLPHGYLAYVGSTSGRKPVPYMNVYSSTKAFLHNFAVALRAELAGGPPKVLLAIPGAVRTGFPGAAGLPADFTASGLPPGVVGEMIVKAIEDGRDGIMPIGSLKERYGGWLQRILPPTFWASKMRAFYEPMLRKREP
ncbi:MAG: SDR family NAD(P)-dependent oxidoreductase [Acidobacteriota bacterium]